MAFGTAIVENGFAPLCALDRYGLGREKIRVARSFGRENSRCQLFDDIFIVFEPVFKSAQIRPTSDLVPENVRVNRVARNNGTVRKPARLVLEVPPDGRLAVGNEILKII